jgi:hypothetical protein
MKNKFHWEEIKKLAIAHQLEEVDSSTEALLRFLRFWWCRTYNRPFKDPLLMTYTADELTYEFLRYFYAKPENDPKKKMEEQQATKDDEAWIAKMLSQTKQEAPAKPASPANQPKPEEKSAKEPEMPNLPEISAKFDPNP